MSQTCAVNNQNNHLTVECLIRFSLPLALTFLMMAGSAPLVSGGITIMNDAAGERVHLYAFLMTFVISLLVYSPMFVARNVAIRTITDRRSMFRYAKFFVTCASISSVILVLIGKVDAVGHFLFGTLLNTELQTELLARQGILIFTPVPIMVALRGLAHGCHIINGQTWYVGAGTGVRLVCMALFVFGYGIHRDFSGPVFGALTFCFGIGIETLFVLVTLWNKPQWRMVGTERPLDYGEYLRYAGPLMLASALTQLLGPVLIYLINHSRLPAENGATFDLIRATGWVMFSMLHSIQPVVITHANSIRNFKIIIRFSAIFTVAITAITMLVALTPLREMIFVDLLEVDNKIILELTFLALLWLIPHPIITLTNLYVAAMHTRSGRTVWVTIGSIVGFIVLALLAIGIDLAEWDGVILAVIAAALFNLTSAVVQMVGLWGGGFRASVSPASLVERFDRQAGSELDDLESM